MSTRDVGHGGLSRVYRLSVAGRYGPMSLVLWARGRRLPARDWGPVVGLLMLAQRPLRKGRQNAAVPRATAAGRTARADRRARRPGSAGPVPASSSGAIRGRAYAPILQFPSWQWQTYRRTLRFDQRSSPSAVLAAAVGTAPGRESWQTCTEVCHRGASSGGILWRRFF